MTESAEINRYLMSKKLPLDLLLEVRDHMVEQIQAICEEKSVDFSTAFEEVKKLWADDLKIRKTFYFFGRMVTKLEVKTTRKCQSEINRKVIPVMLGIIGVDIFLAFKAPKIDVIFMLLVYCAVAVMGMVYTLLNIRLVKSRRADEVRRISIYQSGTSILLLGWMYIITFNLINFQDRIARLKPIIMDMLAFESPDLNWLTVFVMRYAWLFATMSGVLFLRQYIRAVDELKLRMDLKI